MERSTVQSCLAAPFFPHRSKLSAWPASPTLSTDAIVIKRSLPYEGLLHEIVEHNGVLYLGGIVPEDAGLDMAGQADDVLRQLKTLLEGAGSDLSCVLQVTIFMAEPRRQGGVQPGVEALFHRRPSAGARRHRRCGSRAGRQAGADGDRRTSLRQAIPARERSVILMSTHEAAFSRLEAPEFCPFP